MRKIIVNEFMTLDGVIEAPEEWQFPYLSEDVSEEIRTGVYEAEASLLGRKTYEIFAASWPLRTNNEFGVADKLNSERKFVVSSTLEEVEWNNSTLIKGNVEEEVRKLKQQPGGVIRIVGSATLVQSLMKADLIDEFQLMIHPVVVGHGKRLFNDAIGIPSLKLVETKAFSTGVVLLHYQSDKK
ncbi:MAG: dihydrofolate reductase family protein [Chloroflexi bacterium]|nr:dihydrofolate reductase family protein [Chloroflexota bacterium]